MTSANLTWWQVLHFRFESAGLFVGADLWSCWGKPDHKLVALICITFVAAERVLNFAPEFSNTLLSVALYVLAAASATLMLLLANKLAKQAKLAQDQHPK